MRLVLGIAGRQGMGDAAQFIQRAAKAQAGWDGQVAGRVVMIAP